MIDFMVGGKSLFCVGCPDGREFWSNGIYREIFPRKRITTDYLPLFGMLQGDPNAS